MQFSQYWPHDHEAESFSRPLDLGEIRHPGSPLPVPPRDLWAHYCTSVESYLESGREDCQTMRRLLADSGAPIEGASRILELGCAGGRMLRWLTDLAPEIQLWGTDIWSTAILWCQDHLSPPCYFATNTMTPHLPYEDRSFGLIYCGSLFTHIDDLAESWFLELHRILRPGGRLYFSINDQHAVCSTAKPTPALTPGTTSGPRERPTGTSSSKTTDAAPSISASVRAMPIWSPWAARCPRM